MIAAHVQIHFVLRQDCKGKPCNQLTRQFKFWSLHFASLADGGFTQQFGFEVFKAFNSADFRRFNPMSITLFAAGLVVQFASFSGVQICIWMPTGWLIIRSRPAPADRHSVVPSVKTSASRKRCPAWSLAANCGVTSVGHCTPTSGSLHSKLRSCSGYQ